jgi:hypothetical protein
VGHGVGVDVLAHRRLGGRVEVAGHSEHGRDLVGLGIGDRVPGERIAPECGTPALVDDPLGEVAGGMT